MRQTNATARSRAPAGGVALFALMVGTCHAQVIDATWTGPDVFGQYANAANWDIGVVPINTGDARYRVILPGRPLVLVQGTGAFTIDAVVADDPRGGFAVDDSTPTILDVSSMRGLVESGTAFGTNLPAMTTLGTLGGPGIACVAGAGGVGRVVVLASQGEIRPQNATSGSVKRVFSAKDTGVLEAPGLTALRLGLPPGGRANDTYQLLAMGGGLLDFPSLEEIVNVDGTGGLVFVATGSNARVRLDALDSIDGFASVSFLTQGAGSIALGSLRAAPHSFDVDGGSVIAPSLESLADAEVSATDPDSEFITGDLTSIDRSDIAIHSSIHMPVVAEQVNYTGSPSGQGFTVVGAGSNLSLSGVRTIRFELGHLNPISFRALDGAVLDFAGLREVLIDPAGESVVFEAEGDGSVIDAPGVERADARVHLLATEGDSLVRWGTDASRVQVDAGGTVEIVGSIGSLVIGTNVNTREHEGHLVVLGPDDRTVEVSTVDEGASPAGAVEALASLNVGQPGTAALLALRDGVFGDTDGDGEPDPEALYLVELGINAGSTLALDRVNFYLLGSDGVTWTEAAALIPEGWNCVRFDDGRLCRNSCMADVNGDFTLDLDDVDAIAVAFLTGDVSADFDGDGSVDGDDIDLFVELFPLGCP